MKTPKFVIRVGGCEYAITSNKGVATIMSVLSEAIPVDADLDAREITLKYADKPHMLIYLTEVRCVRIPPGTIWKREKEDGTVEILRPAGLADAPPARKPQAKQLQGRQPMQLEFGGSRP